MGSRQLSGTNDRDWRRIIPMKFSRGQSLCEIKYDSSQLFQGNYNCSAAVPHLIDGGGDLFLQIQQMMVVLYIIPLKKTIANLTVYLNIFSIIATRVYFFSVLCHISYHICIIYYYIIQRKAANAGWLST